MNHLAEGESAMTSPSAWQPARRSLVPFLFLFLLVGGVSSLAFSPAAADDVKPIEFKLPSVFDKSAPEGIEDLKAIQEHVRKVLDKVIPCTVGVRIGQAQGSGVIVSKDGIVLTAGHVSGTPGKDC